MVASRKRKPARASQASPATTAEMRPSGVRRVAKKARSVPPPPLVPVDEVLRCLAAGEEDAALAHATPLLFRTFVPVMCAGPRELRDANLDARARWLVPFIDGETPLPRVLESCALPTLDALHAICALLDQKLVALR